MKLMQVEDVYDVLYKIARQWSVDFAVQKWVFVWTHEFASSYIIALHMSSVLSGLFYE